MNINIVMEDSRGVGYGYIFEYERDVYLGEIYLERLDKRLLINNGSCEKIINKLNEGKSYSIDYTTKLDGINQILDFYFMGPLKELPTIENEKSIADGVNKMRELGMKYYVFYTEY